MLCVTPSKKQGYLLVTHAQAADIAAAHNDLEHAPKRASATDAQTASFSSMGARGAMHNRRYKVCTGRLPNQPEVHIWEPILSQ